MLKLIESKQEIADAQHRLEVAIRRDFTKREIRTIGYPGGKTFDAPVVTDGIYWYHSTDFDSKDIANPRRLNWFGLFSPEGVLQISVEVNAVYEGRNDRVAGFFARDSDTRRIYLLHTGRVGGGTNGVGKSAFLAWSNHTPIEVSDSSGAIRDGILVMPVDGVAATHSVIRYIDAIVAFKRAVRAGEINTPEFGSKKQLFESYYAEARGRRRRRNIAEIDYLSRHGDVVDALSLWRILSPLPSGGHIVKNVLIDMGVATGCDLAEIYEVKTSVARSDVYSAIGQLMVHGPAPCCRRVIVLPDGETIAADLNTALQRLGIEILRFKLTPQKVLIL